MQYDCLPSDDDRKIVAEFCDRLKNFNNVTGNFFGIKYPTANLFCIEIAEIKFFLYDWSKSEIFEIKDMSLSMIKKN